MPIDPLTPAERSAVMRRVPATGSKPEVKVRHALHAAGYRYRLNRADLPGKPDLVFPRYRMAVFVHGCFWHWHGCKRSRMPAANNAYWTAKIARNVARDARNQAALQALGWRVVVIWECQLVAGIAGLIARLDALRAGTPLPAPAFASGAILPTCTMASGAEGGKGLDERLHEAAASGDVDAIQALLADGAKIDGINSNGETALLVATHGNQIAASRALIEAGADVNAKDFINDSPYLYAGARGYNEILQLTLLNGADLTSTNRYGGTALIPACERGHLNNVRTLIAAGVDVNHVNKLQWTALLEAIFLGDGGPVHTEIVQALVDAGADVNLADGDGVTPLQHARQRGYTAMVAILEAAGAR
ncbi:MAG: DNA mismatch endonuclease Vsr [Thermomicrobiales bacterium]